MCAHVLTHAVTYMWRSEDNLPPCGFQRLWLSGLAASVPLLSHLAGSRPIFRTELCVYVLGTSGVSGVELQDVQFPAHQM